MGKELERRTYWAIRNAEGEYRDRDGDWSPPSYASLYEDPDLPSCLAPDLEAFVVEVEVIVREPQP